MISGSIRMNSLPDAPPDDVPPDDPLDDRYADFVGLLARHDQAVRRFVRALLPTGDGVDDVMQETALECWRKYDQFSDTATEVDGEFTRWACVIARYKALSWQRDRARDRLVFRESVIEQLAASAELRLDRGDHEREAIERCLDQLPADQRRLLLSVHSPGESVARIASETGQRARKLYSVVQSLRKLLLRCVESRLASESSHG
ncbi:RNA polymerase sigma factor [Crateriforma conspicua]|nr:RNA polymerase sigma factor [Crateriforma conspicua]